MNPPPTSPLRRATNHFARVAIAVSGLAVLATGGPMTTLAAESRIPISGPVAITVPGSYVVTRDFTAPNQAIVVEASPVDIDLNGHTIGTQSAEAEVVGIWGGYSATVHDGRITGGYIGVSANGGGDHKDRVRLARVEIRGATLVGFDVSEVAEFVLEDSAILDCEFGVHVYVGGARTKGRIANSRFFTNQRAIDLNGVGAAVVPGCIVENNVIESAVDAAVVVNAPFAGVVVRGNTITTTSGSGIYVGGAGGNHIESNTVRRAAGIGIEVPSRSNRIAGNTVSACGSHAMLVAGNWNLLDGNTLDESGGYGLSVTGTANVIRANVARGNTVGAYSFAGGNSDGGGNF